MSGRLGAPDVKGGVRHMPDRADQRGDAEQPKRGE